MAYLKNWTTEVVNFGKENFVQLVEDLNSETEATEDLIEGSIVALEKTGEATFSDAGITITPQGFRGLLLNVVATGLILGENRKKTPGTE